jgi:hypothetical protein
MPWGRHRPIAVAQLGQPATAEEELTVVMSSVQPFTAAHLYLALLRPQSILRL